jgi:ABC-2 type transport system ATP-binding protein
LQYGFFGHETTESMLDMMGSVNVIEIRDLEVQYRTGFWKSKIKKGLTGLTLDIREHEIFGFLGPNGAGKTTTLKALVGLNSYSRGTVTIFGKSAQDPSSRTRLGFQPEQPYFYDHLNAHELLRFYGQLSGVTVDADQADRLLRRVGLDSGNRAPMRKYSKGMMQRLGIAQAILHDPPLLILDEPMSGLDPMGRREVRELIQSFKDEGKTVLFSTHILSDAEALCDRVGVIHGGKLRGVATVAELLAQARGQFEVIWQGAPHALDATGHAPHEAGETFAVRLPESDLNSAIDAIRAQKGRIVSINPVRGMVEDYFVAHVQPETAQS